MMHKVFMKKTNFPLLEVPIMVDMLPLLVHYRKWWNSQLAHSMEVLILYLQIVVEKPSCGLLQDVLLVWWEIKQGWICTQACKKKIGIRSVKLFAEMFGSNFMNKHPIVKNLCKGTLLCTVIVPTVTLAKISNGCCTISF